MGLQVQSLLRRPNLAGSKLKVKGLSIVDLVDILDKNGFKNLKALETIPPNPMLWSKRDWNFAVSLIAASTQISEDKVKKQFDTPKKLLEVFNTALRKTGLVIEMEQIKKISEGNVLDGLPKKFDFEFERTE